MANGNKPAMKVRIGFISGTIWHNGDFFNTEIRKAFKDDKDEWRDGTSFSHGDLLNVAKVAERCEAWIADQQQQ